MRPNEILRMLALALAVGAGPVACTPPTEELMDEDLESEPDWQELMSDRGAVYEPNPAFEMPEIVLTPDRLSALPAGIRRSPDLAHLAVSRQLAAPVPYEGGVFGTVGAAKMWVGTTAEIKDFSRLYWVMVKVLSEKYGCFMVAKQNFPERTWVKCRDKRQIVLWPSKGPGWIQFFGRQYDRDGFEIMVKKKKIVRISEERVL